MKNEFDCLTNAILQASLRVGLPVAFAVPPRVRDLMQKHEVGDVFAVTIHQCPRELDVINYKLAVHLRKGEIETESFQGSSYGFDLDHDTYVLYDRWRDGRMKHLHLLH